MRIALSTNWNNARLDDGAAIADEAIALGFDALELGFRTMPEQLPGFKSRLDQIPVDSVHAYCPVPIGAPSGHPELHQLAHHDEEERALARLLLKKTIECAVDLGAKVVVTHAGYAELDGLFVNLDSSVLRRLAKGKDDKPDVTRPAYVKHLAKAHVRRKKRGRKLLEVFRRELEASMSNPPLMIWLKSCDRTRSHAGSIEKISYKFPTKFLQFCRKWGITVNKSQNCDKMGH